MPGYVDIINYPPPTNRVQLSAPAATCAAVTPHDSTNFTNTARALYIGGTGDVVVVDTAGTATTFTAVPVGILPVQCIRVNSTDTTATDIVALF